MPTFNLKDKHCRLSKYSNNLLEHGKQEVPEWTFWVSDLMLEREEVNILVGDRLFDRALFNQARGIREPIDGLREFEPLAFKKRFEHALITITCSGDRELEFKEAKIYGISIEPKTGGLIATRFKLQFTPGIGKPNLILQEHQNSEIRLSVTDAKIALKKGGQQDLGLEHGEEDGDEEDGDQPSGGKKRGRADQLNA